MKKVRTVYLPLPKLEECQLCSSKTSLRLCSACGECTYCSPKCQKEDWPKHKFYCGKTERIDLERFYPLLATFAESLHQHPKKPPHPALVHTILNAPNPGSPPTRLPDGSAATFLLLGDRIEIPDWISSEWWPLGASNEVRSKMFRRIVHGGYVLPVVMSICLSLLSEIYTTTYVPAENSPEDQQTKRVRLTYKSSPIADFGIAAGSVNVLDQDKLAFRFAAEDEGSFFHGQNPKDHYWIYFTTIRGEDIWLDCCMFTFNMCLILDATPYCSPRQPRMKGIPVYFRGRQLERHAIDLCVERRRVSVLRNPELQRAIARSPVGYEPKDIELICNFMEMLAGRPLTSLEMELTLDCANENAAVLAEKLETRAWANFPEMPDKGVDLDPDEDYDSGEDDDETWLKHLRKIKKNKDNGAAVRAEMKKWDARRAKNRKEKA